MRILLTISVIRFLLYYLTCNYFLLPIVILVINLKFCINCTFPCLIKLNLLPFDFFRCFCTFGYSLSINLQAGEFFSSALTSAAAQQREMESQQTGEMTIETPLLTDKVQMPTLSALYNSIRAPLIFVLTNPLALL